MRRSGLLLILSLGCASNNVAQLASQVRVENQAAAERGCRSVGVVKGPGMTRELAQRRALFRGANLIVAGATDPRGGFEGYAWDCGGNSPLLRQLTGVTFVPPGQLPLVREKPQGCDAIGAPVEAYSDGRAGSAEDGLRRMAEVVDANYVRILKTLDVYGRTGLRGQPYVCPLQP